MKKLLSNPDVVHSDAALVRSITTSAQREMCLIEKAHPGAKCNLWFYRLIRGPLDVDILSNVIKWLTLEIPLFQTRFSYEDGELWQIHDHNIRSNIRTIDVSYHPTPLEEALRKMKDAEIQPSCITGNELYEFKIYTINSNTRILYAQFHHAIIDVRSWCKLESLIAAAYNGLKKGQSISMQPNLCFDALDQANAAYIASNEYQQDEQFWKAYVQPLKRHAYTHRNIDLRGMQTTNRCVQSLCVSNYPKLQQTAIAFNVSESILYIGVSAFLLRSLIGSEYVSVSVPMYGTHSTQELGMTSNTLPLLLHIPESATFKDALVHIAEEIKSVLMHQRYRIEDIRQLANYSSSESFGPQINVMCYDHGDEFEGCSSSSHFGACIDSNELQISFWTDRSNDRLDIIFDDIAEGHTQEQLASLKDRLISIFDLVVYVPNSKISTLEALDERCRQINTNEQCENFYANRRTPVAAGFLQWNRCADDLVRFVHANAWVGSGPSPFVTSKVLLADRVISINKLKRTSDSVGTKQPGTVLGIKENCWHVAVADGVVEINDFFDENGQTQSAQTLAKQYDLLENSQLPVITPEQADWLNDTHMQTTRSKPYWSQRLTEFEPCILSIARSSSNQSPLWAASSFQILPSADFNATELLAAWLIYIARDTKLSQLQIGWDATESNNQYRDNNVLANYIFAKTVPFSTVIDLDDTFSGVVTSIKKDCNQLVNSLPCFTDLFVRHAMSSTHHLSGNKMYDLAVSMIETQDEHLLENTDLDVHSNFLTLQINKCNASFRWIYDSNRISEEEVKRISSHLLVLLASAKSVDQVQKPVGKLDILPKTERDLLLNVWNQRETTKSAKNCIHQMFEQQVKRDGSAIAIEYEEETMSYAELNARANRLAHYLIEKGVKPDTRIAICLDRGPKLIVATLGVLKAGGAYVPLDPIYSSQRLTTILQDVDPLYLLADSLGQKALGTHHVPLVNLDEILSSDLPVDNPDPLELGLTPSHLSHIIYTSGTTGTPKGVMVEHQQVTRLFEVAHNKFGINNADKWSLFHSPAFGAAIWEIWGALFNGCKLAVAPYNTIRSPFALYEWVSTHGITVLNQTPSAFKMFMEAKNISSHSDRLRYIILVGEELDPSIVKEWHEQNPDTETILINTYGTTETLRTTYQRVDASNYVRSIGRPFFDLCTYLLDSYGELVPLGAEGELYIGGAGVTCGYLNRPELTAERFLSDPFSEMPGARMYRTGDLARYLPDGNLVYLGRADQQVKIRGYRIEPGEIEALLVDNPLVREAVVLPCKSSPDSDIRLVAYVISDADASLAQNLRTYLSSLLPDYMVPSAYVCLSSFPLNPNGKLDKKALQNQSPNDESFARQSYEAPQGEMEEKLATIWSELLGIESISRHDNFFALGGHSLLIIRMLSKLRQIGLDTDVREVFDALSLARLAETLVHHKEIITPPNVITADTTMITPEMLPLITLSQTEIDNLVTKVPEGVSNIQDIYGLTPLQEGMLFHHTMAEEGDTYLLINHLEFGDRATLDLYAGALQQVIERHDILRTIFVWEGLNEPAQVVLRQVKSLLTEVTLDDSDEAALEQLINRFNPRHFRLDLKQAPLLRLMVAPKSNGRWVALQLMHHIIGDFSTLQRLYAEVHSIIDGHSDRLLTPTPFRHAVAQARFGVSDAEHTKFFSDMLGDIDSPTLPFGLSDVHGDGSEIDKANVTVPNELSNQLRALARRFRVSVASLCHLAWAQVLAHTSGNESIVFGTVLLSGLQSGEGSDNAMGLLINTLPLRIDIDNDTVESAVRKAHSRLSALLSHEYASLALAQRCSALPANLPLFSALLNYRHATQTENVTQLPAGVTMFSNENQTNYPLSMSLDDNDKTLSLLAEVVPPVSAKRICGYMQHALASLADALSHTPQLSIRTLNVTPLEEREMLLYDFNKTTVNYPPVCCLHQLFEAQVEQNGQAIAVEYKDEKLTYDELNTQANQLAHYLIERGVKPDDRIAVCVKRSTKLIVALLGILKSGGAYVPLDPVYTSQRLTNILEDSEPICLLADDTGRKALGNHQVPIIDLYAALPGALLTTNPDPNNLELSPTNLAYVIYTSGSTGKPKGVMIEHQTAHNFAHSITSLFDVTSDSHVLQFASCGFDTSLEEIIMAITTGACLSIPSEEVRRTNIFNYIASKNITHAELPPAILHNLQESMDLTKLEVLLLSGEAPSLSVLQMASSCAKVFNSYGPTETTITATNWLYSTNFKDHSIPIGRPLSNIRLYLLDARGEPVPLGADGELYIGGACVARGYLNRPELTAERFLPDPFSEIPGARMYRTGDLARYLSDGNLIFLGRTDHQIKIRGYRIEPGEIEARLIEHPLVREAVVLPWKSKPNANAQLIAYVVSDPDTSLSQNLRNYLASSLPDYMVPAAYICLDSLPLTTNGKLNRHALPPPSDTAFAHQMYEAPQGEMEIRLASLWSNLLGIERIGRHDNFFELGGHSLLAMQFANQARNIYNIHVDARGLFSFPILKDFAERTFGGSQRLYSDSAIPVRRHGNRTPIFLLADGYGDTSYAFELAHEIDKNYPVYALQWSSPAKEQPASIEEMASTMIPLIKNAQPNGPCAIAGYSSGGILAYEIVNQLIHSGYSVSFLGLIDTYPKTRAVNEIEYFLDCLAYEYQTLETFKDTVWWNRLMKLTLNEVTEEIKKRNEDFKIPDIEWEVLLLKQRIHYQHICNMHKINSLPITVNLFKATEHLSRNKNLDNVPSETTNSSDKSYNVDELSWENCHLPNFSVTLIKGDHFTMMTDPNNRASLGTKISTVLNSK